jgi:hypothetical protein
MPAQARGALFRSQGLFAGVIPMPEAFHQMVVEDEILFCGLVLAVGILVGGVARLVSVLRRRGRA